MMNQSLSLRKLTYLLCSLCMSVLLFCGYAPKVRAEELITIDGESIGILQEGGLLPEEEESDASLFTASTPNYTGAEKAITTALKNFRSSVNLSSYHLSLSQFISFYRGFINSHPEFFYLDGQYYDVSNDYVKTLYFRYSSSDTAVLKQMTTDYEKEVRAILASVDSSWSDLEKVLYINDYLALNCEYDLTYQNYDAYDVLVSKTAVCQGYALAYLDLMNRLDVPCGTVSSNSLNHIWNLVQLNGSWYHVDTTWNDPVPDYCGYAGHNYLLKSTKWFLSDKGGHKASDYVYSDSLSASDAASTLYDNYFWNDIYAPFGYWNGHWYTNDNSSLKEYTGSGTGLKENKTLKTLTKKWNVWGSTSSYYSSSFEGCSVFSGKLYYATPTSIQALDLTTGKAVSPAPLSLSGTEKAKGYIYGFHITSDGTLEYAVSQGPNQTGVRRKTPIHTHSFGSWTITKTNNCTRTGERRRICSTCNYQDIQDIAALGHKPGIAATCTTDQTCTVCKTVLKKATGHQHTKTTTKKATFLKAGYVKTVCQDCQKTLQNKTLARVACKKGTTYTVGSYKYKILSPKTNGKGTVSFRGLAKKVKNVTVKDTVTILGVQFQVVQINDKALKNQTSVTSVTIGKNVRTIGKEAFYGTKNLKTITVKSTKITKVGSKALTKTYAKAKIKVPGSRLKKYKALFKNKGQKSTVKIY